MGPNSLMVVYVDPLGYDSIRKPLSLLEARGLGVEVSGLDLGFRFFL